VYVYLAAVSSVSRKKPVLSALWLLKLLEEERKKAVWLGHCDSATVAAAGGGGRRRAAGGGVACIAFHDVAGKAHPPCRLPSSPLPTAAVSP